MKKCVLIQANGNNERLGKFFDIPKHELFFDGKKILDHILLNCEKLNCDIFISIRENTKINSELKNFKVIECSQTFNRIDTLEQCLKQLENYDSVLVLDSDVIISYEVLKFLNGNSLAVGPYKYDGKKYGFVDVNPSFEYISGNEKENETNYITVGAYSFNKKSFLRFLNLKNNRSNESLLNYYNIEKPKIFFSNSHICLGDINCYMEAIWSSQ